MFDAEDQLLDKTAAARLIEASPRLVGDRAWRQRFALPCVKVGGSLRFPRNALLRWLEERSERPSGAV
jgi:hypothetical protein